LLCDHLFSMTLTYCHSPIICAGSSWRFVKLARKIESRRADSNRLPLLISSALLAIWARP
jgi:hypothetical protein